MVRRERRRAFPAGQPAEGALPEPEYALELLSRSGFPDGLRAGVLAEVRVAHKFGERTNTPTGEHQRHDCGIVYAPDRPYLLCVMTRGRDFRRLPAVISEISRSVYTALEE